MKQFKTEQEQFWAGKFGDSYVDRNMDKKFLAANISLWSNIIRGCFDISSCLEFGPNVGLNLMALGTLIPDLDMYGVEINEKAAIECNKIDRCTVYNDSILEFATERKYDLVFTSGVLIHINPDELLGIYDKMYDCAEKYIVIAEYYNPKPVEVNYRGNTEKLFKRDFAGEMMDRYPDLQLISYGFCYHRDNNFPMDDITWFLLKK